MSSVVRVFFAVLLFALVLPRPNAAVQNTILAKDGVIDLRHSDFSGSETWLLNGDWKFYWHKFISPSTKAAEEIEGPSIPLEVPGYWRGRLFVGAPLPRYGWGSYRLRIQLPPKTPALSLQIGAVGTAYRLYANGELIAQAGVVGKDAAATEPAIRIRTANLPQADAANSITLVMHIANYDDKNGGIWRAVKFGPTPIIEAQHQRSQLLDIFLIGALSLIGLHHLFLFLRSRKEPAQLALALICLDFALRTALEESLLIYLVFPDASWYTVFRFAYLTFYIGAPLVVWFLREIFPLHFHRRVFQGSVIFMGIMSAVVVFSPPAIYTETLVVAQTFVLFLIVYSSIGIFRAMLAKEPGARTLGFALLILFLTISFQMILVHYPLVARDVGAYEFSLWAFLLLILAQSLVLGMRQERAYTALVHLTNENKSLIASMDRKIIERTATIAELNAEGDAVLDSLNEGVFLLNAERKIGLKFSTKLLDIFELESEDIAGVTFDDFIAKATLAPMTDDTRIFLNVLFNPVMDDMAACDLNPLQKMPITSRSSGKKRIVSFNFTRQWYNKKIRAVFVSVKDITADEALKVQLAESTAKAQAQQEIVHTLFSVKGESLRTFYESIAQEMADIEDALNPEDTLDNKLRVEKVFRAAHTIKGSAQLFQVHFIANAAHNFETALQEVRERDSIENIDLLGVQVAIADFYQALDEFEVAIERMRRFKNETESIQFSAVDLLRTALPRLVVDLSEKLDKKVRLEFENFTTESIPREFVAALRDCLVQTLRNALTHSIELPRERAALGKNEDGLITIAVRETKETLDVVVRDDGRSFDIAAIKRRAVERGLIRESDAAALDDKKALDFIFESGFSTAVPGGVTAGRGVGMEVIAKKIKQLGGTIRIDWQVGIFTEFTFALPKK